VLTDSGGFQVFSLAARRRLDADGVSFRSHIDGAEHRLTPENVVDAQADFGVDVAMVLDECLPYPVDRPTAEARCAAWTGRWAASRGLDRGRAPAGRRGVGRAGCSRSSRARSTRRLRRRCSESLAEHPFDGFAIGGLAVGEPTAALHEAVAMAAPMLPDQTGRAT
jgi:queuine tRNA-ribosyltransferase